MPRQCNIMFVTPSSLTLYCSLLFPHWFVTAHGGWDRDWGGETAAQHRCEAWHGGGADAVWVLRSRQARGHHSTAGICLHQGGVPVILSCQLPPHATWTSWAWRVHEVMLLIICVVCVALSWEFCFMHEIMLLINYCICVVPCVELLFLCEVTLLIMFCLCCAIFQAPFHVWDKS